MHNKHLAKRQRYYIYQRLKVGKSLRQRAKNLARNISMIRQEFSKNKGLRGYCYQ